MGDGRASADRAKSSTRLIGAAFVLPKLKVPDRSSVQIMQAVISIRMN